MKFTPPVPKCPRHMFSVLAVCSCTKVVIDMEHNRPANPCDIFGHMIIAWCWLNRFHLITGTISNHRSHWHSRWVGHRMWRIPCSSSNPKAESSPIFDMVILWHESRFIAGDFSWLTSDWDNRLKESSKGQAMKRRKTRSKTNHYDRLKKQNLQQGTLRKIQLHLTSKWSLNRKGLKHTQPHLNL